MNERKSQESSVDQSKIFNTPKTGRFNWNGCRATTHYSASNQDTTSDRCHRQDIRMRYVSTY